ncbi:MAG: hypothetical protein LIO95_03580 [Clostridiales bacterium]|nr:hypothetical protein [Clostridiales bacterium]
MAIFSVLLCLASELLRTKWLGENQDRYAYGGVYDVTENTIDVLVLGSSQVSLGIDPVEMYNCEGISAYALGGANTALMASYYWLVETEKTQDVSVVLLETSSLLEEIQPNHERKRLDSMKLSLDKLRFIQDIQAHTDESFLSFLMPIIKYHTRWSALKEVDFTPDADSGQCYRGFNIEEECIKNLDYSTVMIDNDDPTADTRGMYEYQLVYFEKIVAYCQENDIELILFKTPKQSWTLSDFNQVQTLADSYGLTYLDFNWEELLDAIGYDVETDMRDKDHLSVSGADKLSSYLAEYLAANCDLPDRREDEDYDLQIDQALYETERTDAYLYTTTDPAEWLTLLKNHSTTCDIFLSTYGDTAGVVSDEIAALLADLGLETDLNTLEEGYGFVAWLTSDGTSVEEKSDYHYIRIKGTLDNGVAYQVVSRNQEDQKQSKQLIDGEDQSINTAGLNITLYDEEQELVLETVCIDLETGEMTCVTRAG